MAEKHYRRMTARMKGDFVVLLIGMKVNNILAVWQWLPVTISMWRMLKELESKPESGFLGFEPNIGNPSIMIQYWESFEKLEAYARSKDSVHYPAWVKFNKNIKNNKAVGIWHETYKVAPNSYENIYTNMEPFGLGKVGELLQVGQQGETARERISNKNQETIK